MPQINQQDDLYVVIISTKEDRNRLYNFCLNNNIPILYPKLFKEKKIYHLWGLSKTGVGLVSTIIARHTKTNHIVHSIDELKTVFN